MKTFIGTNTIEAKPMTRADYSAYRCWDLQAHENGADDGYLVKHAIGGKPDHLLPGVYITWIPKVQFESAYRETTGLTFGLAIEAMKAGKCVARAGWNGKGMCLWLMPAATVPVEWCKEPRLKQLAEENGGAFEALGTIRMKTADNKVLTGWLASQTDMLAEDWTIVE